MSMSSPRKSTDSLVSPDSPLSLSSLQSPQSPTLRRSAYPFPSFTPDLSSNTTNRYRPRRGSTASSISINSVANSVGGSLDIHASRTNIPVMEAGQNAISSLLQPAILRTGLLTPASASSSSATYKAPTARDIPPVTLTNIPHVDPSAFKDYLSRIGPLFESFQRARAEDRAASKSSSEKSESTDPAQRPILSRQGSAVSLLSPVDSPKPRRRSSAYARRRHNEPTPLSTIPNVYFDDNFHLENPRTFDVVSEHAEIVKPPPGTVAQDQNGAPRPPRKSLASNAILQEKLSWYMDTVEIHLISSISNASASFFAALGSLRHLEHEAADSVRRIQKLRADLAKLDQDMAMGGLHVVSLRRRHENLRKLGRAVEQVACVVDHAKDCEGLVEEGKYQDAAQSMSRLERLVSGQSGDDEPDLLDLRPLKALQGLSDGLSHLQLRISKGFETRFLDALLSDLHHHVESVPPSHTLRRWASSFQRIRGEARVQAPPPAYMESTADLRANLLASLNGLTSSEQSARATAAFRESVLKEMKSLIRKHLPSSSDDDAESTTSVSTRGGRQLSQQEKSAILARNLRALDEESADQLFVKIYTGVSESLRRLSVQTKVLLDVTSTVNLPSQPQSNIPSRVRSPDGQRGMTRSPIPAASSLQEELTQAMDLSSLLGQAVDIAQTQITRILKVRTEQSVRLPPRSFLRYFTLNRLFADECEAVSGHSGSALKTIVAGQLTGFVHARSDMQNQRIAQRLDSDQWDATDFTEEDQTVLSRILQGMSSDPPIWLRATRIWDDSTSEKTDTSSKTNGGPANDTNGEAPSTSKPQVRSAYIDETRYILVASAISLLEPIDGFLSLIASVPSISSVAVQGLVDLLRTLNSRTSQLVLGAGATRIAGLKNITTKHLALASQALSFVIALVPYMREAVRRHVGSGKSDVLAEFDKVKRLYQDHQMGIHDKLVEIMTARAAAHVNVMKKTEFDTKAAGAGDGASPYMETLVKETATLFRVLSRHLSEPDVAGILTQIFGNYKDTWTRAFGEVEIRTAEGKERLLKDAEVFDVKLSKIDGFGDIGKSVMEVIKARKVAEQQPPTAAPASKEPEQKVPPAAPVEQSGADKTVGQQ